MKDKQLLGQKIEAFIDQINIKDAKLYRGPLKRFIKFLGWNTDFNEQDVIEYLNSEYFNNLSSRYSNFQKSLINRFCFWYKKKFDPPIHKDQLNNEFQSKNNIIPWTSIKPSRSLLSQELVSELERIIKNYNQARKLKSERINILKTKVIMRNIVSYMDKEYLKVDGRVIIGLALNFTTMLTHYEIEKLVKCPNSFVGNLKKKIRRANPGVISWLSRYSNQYQLKNIIIKKEM